MTRLLIIAAGSFGRIADLSGNEITRILRDRDIDNAKIVIKLH